MDNPIQNQAETAEFPMLISKAAAHLGIKSSIARSFCDRGLIPQLKRNSKHERILEAWQVQLLYILVNMKQAGFSSRDLRAYSRLFRQGKGTADQRLAMLTTKKRQLWHEIAARQSAIDFIERQEELARDGNS